MPAPPNYETLSLLPPLSSQPPMKRKRVLTCNSIPITTQLLKEDNRTNLSPFYKWCPQDDLMLKEAVEKGMSAPQIAQMVKFSSKFTKQDIEERWSALLYDEKEAAAASRGMLALMQMTRRIPWTREEDEIIKEQIEKYGYLAAHVVLDQYKEHFHPTRTVKTLEAHFYRLKRAGEYNAILHFHHTASNWKKLREYYRAQLTPEQIAEYESFVPEGAAEEEESEQSAVVENASAEATTAPPFLTSGGPFSPRRPIIVPLDANNSKKRKRSTKDDKAPAGQKKKKSKKDTTADEYIPTEDVHATQSPSHDADDSFQLAVASTSPPIVLPEQAQTEQTRDISKIIRLERYLPTPDAFAVLDGEYCTFPITKDEYILGRKSPEMQAVDIDLTLHSPRQFTSMSRRQALLTAEVRPASGENSNSTVVFILKNTGKRAIYVNGTAIERAQSVQLPDQAYIKFPGDAAFRFLINKARLEHFKTFIVHEKERKRREAEEAAKRQQEEEELQIQQALEAVPLVVGGGEVVPAPLPEASADAVAEDSQAQ